MCSPAKNTEFAVVIDRPEFDWSIAQDDEAVIGLFAADGLSGQGLTDINELSAPFDLAVVAYASDFGARVVLWFLEATTVLPL